MHVNELSEAGRAWYARYLTLFDSGDIEAMRTVASPECTVQINNNVPIHGPDAIAPVLQRIRARYARLDREVVNVYGDDFHFASEMLWHYTRLDGRRVTVPAAHFIDRRGDGLLEAVRIYVDTSPVYD